MTEVKKFNGSLHDLCDAITNHKGLTVLDIYANWCPGCRRVTKMLPQYAQEYPEVQFLKIDSDECPDIKAYFGIDSIPVLKFCTNANRLDPIDTIVGVNLPLIKEKVASFR
ncbi:Thioredoxin family protein [Trichomonas vaginalis G3]|uniref:Thioredoxin family protein n=1 Tax=Trichomonas vaginalis (strain ATCC PRA-98 / G3) TaxID=412133 RepID=A2FU03_TRIV3|nr:cell redox homeostasis [Trichomonas vaginalis G3]EAX91620.1 Thioredoxin family protein [Trichomonas vaginalis G3]KAI5509712.1 cell redox homeostasis [Trichomonas vaginalis G3]|eukprot:XP_001304550.1 Thioredoxin family protein [Trichomonas vaginalis G3]